LGSGLVNALLLTSVLVLVPSCGMAHANFISIQPLPVIPSYDFEPADRNKFEFAVGLEEALGHLWALKLGLEDGDARQAAIHAERPALGPYDAMRPALASHPRLQHTVEASLAGPV